MGKGMWTSPRDLEATQDQMQRQEFMRREKRRKLEDLAAVLKQPEGRRLMLDLLARLGAGAPAGAENLPLRNLGLALLREIHAASPAAGAAITAEIFGGNC